MLNEQQLAAELERLEASLGMPLDLAEALLDAGALEDEQYRTLRRIRDLQWLQQG